MAPGAEMTEFRAPISASEKKPWFQFRLSFCLRVVQKRTADSDPCHFQTLWFLGGICANLYNSVLPPPPSFPTVSADFY